MVKQNTATDPVSAAMSAIESALNLTDDDEAALADAKLPPPARSSEADGRNARPQAKPTPRRRADAPSGGPASGDRA